MVEGQPTVIIYTTPTCPYCVMTRMFLREHGVSYLEKNVASDSAAAKEMIEKSGQMSVPTVDINGEIIVGFDRDAIKKALNLQ